MFGELQRVVSELRCEAGYWKSRHADALKRIEQLKEELEQAHKTFSRSRPHRYILKSTNTGWYPVHPPTQHPPGPAAYGKSVRGRVR
jgi:hypothetical protein